MEDKITYESENILNMEINYILDSCRVCMARCSNMCCIFDEGKTKIINDIEFCTGVLLKKENGVPTKMCETCLGNLSIAFNFKSLCLLADNTFRKILDSMIKTEPLDGDMNLKNNDLSMQSDDNISNNDSTEVKEEICNGGVEIEMQKENQRHNSGMINGSIHVDKDKQFEGLNRIQQ